MKLNFSVLKFIFEAPHSQFTRIPTKDIWSFEDAYPMLSFTFQGASPQPYSFSYLDLIQYQGLSLIPTYEYVCIEIRAALAKAAELAVTGKPQRFIATADQTDFIVTEFTPTGNGLVLVGDQPNMDNWTLSGSTYSFTVGIPLGTVVLIYP